MYHACYTSDLVTVFAFVLVVDITYSADTAGIKKLIRHGQYLGCLFDCSRSGEKLIVGGPDRIRSIIQACISRKDNRFTTLDPEVPVKFHIVCVSSYASKQHTNRVLSSNAPVASCGPPVKRLCRSHIPEFHFRRDCLYCGEICLQRDPRNPISCISGVHRGQRIQKTSFF